MSLKLQMENLKIAHKNSESVIFYPASVLKNDVTIDVAVIVGIEVRKKRKFFI
jgi:hypothetical protein